MFKSLKEIDQKTIDDIQWEMTPEEAIALHLEWGPLRSQAYYNSRDSDNETIYFIINNWKPKPQLQLLRRKGFDMDTLGRFEIPDKLAVFYGELKGVFSLNKETQNWIKTQLS